MLERYNKHAKTRPTAATTSAVLERYNKHAKTRPTATTTSAVLERYNTAAETRPYTTGPRAMPDRDNTTATTERRAATTRAEAQPTTEHRNTHACAMRNGPTVASEPRSTTTRTTRKSGVPPGRRRNGPTNGRTRLSLTLLRRRACLHQKGFAKSGRGRRHDGPGPWQAAQNDDGPETQAETIVDEAPTPPTRAASARPRTAHQLVGGDGASAQNDDGPETQAETIVDEAPTPPTRAASARPRTAHQIVGGDGASAQNPGSTGADRPAPHRARAIHMRRRVAKDYPTAATLSGVPAGTAGPER